MHYFVEIYDDSNTHVGTRSLRADTEVNAKSEARAILATLPTFVDWTVRLFIQPERENYRELCAFRRFADNA